MDIRESETHCWIQERAQLFLFLRIHVWFKHVCLCLSQNLPSQAESHPDEEANAPNVQEGQISHLKLSDTCDGDEGTYLVPIKANSA